tara:strand:+ start:899 stop:1060 length:162 start_codon:yes stop_codon:yes gene_type:complete
MTTLKLSNEEKQIIKKYLEYYLESNISAETEKLSLENQIQLIYDGLSHIETSN